MDYYFETRQMCVGYHKRPLIKDIEIGLKKGEILTLIGPNGAGKSTVLKSIARQLEMISGVVYLDKEDMTQMSGTKLSQKMAVLLTESQNDLYTDIFLLQPHPHRSSFLF